VSTTQPVTAKGSFINCIFQLTQIWY